ncbi:MAG: lipopolysaccharide heptosyltransferase II [Pseudomonadales bacterium]|nr:lipopolysaccharide heptosyltransferase II [Pseudomonadales bacterium]
MAAPEEKTLIIGPSWVGDMVMAQSLFKLIKEKPGPQTLAVMAPDWSRPLLSRMPEVDEIMDLPLAHGELALGKRRAIGRSLRERQFDNAIVLPNSFKSALIPFHARIPRRIGWRGELRDLLLNDCRRLNKSALPLMVQRFAALAFEADAAPPGDFPAPALSIDGDNLQASLQEFQLQQDRPILALAPGAEFGDSKQWPPEHFASLANAMLVQGWQVWIFGSANDALAAESILADIEPQFLAQCHNLAGATSLGQAIDLLSLAATVVSNDSGLMHIASALQRRLVAIYGSTSSEFTPPLAEQVELLATDIECRPCFKRVCPYGHRRCLTELLPEKAIQAVKDLNSAAS